MPPHSRWSNPQQRRTRRTRLNAVKCVRFARTAGRAPGPAIPGRASGARGLPLPGARPTRGLRGRRVAVRGRACIAAQAERLRRLGCASPRHGRHVFAPARRGVGVPAMLCTAAARPARAATRSRRSAGHPDPRRVVGEGLRNMAGFQHRDPRRGRQNTGHGCQIQPVAVFAGHPGTPSCTNWRERQGVLQTLCHQDRQLPIHLRWHKEKRPPGRHKRAVGRRPC